MSTTGPPTDPFDPGAILSARASELAGALADVAAALRRERERLRAAPGIPIPGVATEVGATPLPAGDAATAIESRRRLHALLERHDALRAALRELDLRRPDPVACEEAALAWLHRVVTPRQLLDEIVVDPAVPRPFPRPPVRTTRPPRRPAPAMKIAAAILRFRDQQPGRRIGHLADLLVVEGVDHAVLRHLLHTGCTMVEPEPEPEPEPESRTVGVLLPVRIETRFRPGRLQLRVVPDEPWFVRHDPRVSTGEVDALDRYLGAVAVAPDDPSRTQAWAEFVAHVGGGARAVFLVRHLVVTAPDGRAVVRELDPGDLREEPAFPRIEGFPEQLHVWLARAGGPPTRVLTLDVDRARLRVDFPDPEAHADRRWWEHWDEAVRAGLADEIPLEGDPGDIDALFVTGLGDGDAAVLFDSHRDEGRLSLIPPGIPTNTVDGAPAASLAQDPAVWWDVLQSPATDTDRLVSASLTGHPDLLGNLPGPTEPHQAWSTAMVGSLWPALWGFAGQDVWALPDGTHEAALWAPHALFPEGPLPTLRVGSQPYGLLPATSLERWTADPRDPPVEAALRGALLRLRDEYRAAAEGRGTVDGASTERLLDLIGHVPTSPLFRHRRAWPLELWWLVLLVLGFGTPWDELDRAWRERHPLVDDLELGLARRYGTVGAPRRLTIPLVVPDELPEGQTTGDVLRELVRLAFEGPRLFADTQTLELEFLRFAPDSLLLRLAIRALQVSIGDVGRTEAGESPPGPEPVFRDATQPGRLQRWIEATPSGALHGPTPAAERFRRVADSLRSLADLVDTDPDRTERLLRATVDTAAFRMDPWLVGPPTRRLQALVDQGAAVFRLGAYGWVDRPRPGTPGPTPAGLLHAPSPAQALTATVLRDRAVNDPDAPRWDLDLTSRTVRDADRVAEHVRIGAHLAEAVGREVERVVADPAQVRTLRQRFPVRTEHEGRRTCDGLQVLAAAPGSLGLDADQLTGLDRLRAAMDAYGDLLVAEAVHHVTEGRAEVAGAVMEAAAGLSRPPHLGLLRTPREGRAITTSVVLLLRDVAEPSLPSDPLQRAEVSPASLADAATAAFVREQTGDPADWTFEVAALDEAGALAGTSVTVTLADVGLLPADALALALTDLQRLVAEAGAQALSTAPDRVALIGGEGAERYEQAARLVGLIGRRPAGPDATTEQADEGVDPAPIDADLLARFVLVSDTAAALQDRLAGELALTSDGAIGTADRTVLARLVVAARSWGIAPDPPPEVTAGVTDVGEAADRLLVATAERARALLTDRLAAAPPATPSPSTPSAADLSRDDLVRALTDLVSPTGQVAVAARMARAWLPALHHDPSVDRDWLPTVAAVRESIARIDVHQLTVGAPAAGDGLVPWTNKPGDPWQRDGDDPRRLIIGYAAPTLDLSALPGSARVAVAAVDRFAEMVPNQEQTTGVAFGFDAPAARPPQAILIAVPPVTTSAMDEATVRDIVAETRALARARMARPVDLDPGLRGLLPASILPASGTTAVPLGGK